MSFDAMRRSNLLTLAISRRKHTLSMSSRYNDLQPLGSGNSIQLKVRDYLFIVDEMDSATNLMD